ncbi:hypothetical protein MFIFM68171_06656 [Madurella fahalii]|uniref:BTB domain-containing protein n=1 Tax=Madurella fahalii TaxID=1157608 RepID=A0ABQ0GFA8_9PEZI
MFPSCEHIPEPESQIEGSRAVRSGGQQTSIDFDTSPFSTRLSTLKFAGGASLNVHWGFLQSTPKLAELGKTTKHTAALKHISVNAGHVFIQYLYTGQYRELPWQGAATGNEEAIARLKVSFQVYGLAQEYGLDALGALAKERITQRSEGMSAFVLIDILKDAYPTPVVDDTWLSTFLKSKIKAALQDSEALLSTEIPTSFSDGMAIAKVLLKEMIEAYNEKVQALSLARDPEPLTPKTDTSGDAIPFPNPSRSREVTIGSYACGRAKRDARRAEPTPALKENKEPPFTFDVWGHVTTKKKRQGKKVFEDPFYSEPTEDEPVPHEEPGLDKVERIDNAWVNSWLLPKKDRPEKKSGVRDEVKLDMLPEEKFDEEPDLGF